VRSRAAAIAVAITFLGAVVVLVLPEGDGRVWWFRGFVVAVGLLAMRALVTWIDAQPRVPSTPPFRRRQWWRRSAGHESGRPAARLLELATFSAGDAHRGLRPTLQEVADERLRAHHGIGLDHPRSSELLSPAAWELLRPDRPRPHDLRAPGLEPAAIDALLDELEQL
jgi:hypothetical protein